MSTRYDAHPPMFKNNPLVFIPALILSPVLIGLVIFGVWYLKTRSTRLTITDEEVLFETGILNKERSELDISAVRTVKVKQSLFERMFGTGTIELYTAGDKPEVIAPGMPDPDEVRELLRGD